MALIYLCTSILILYFIIILRFRFLLPKLKIHPDNEQSIENNLIIDVIIPFRNESVHMKSLCQNLKNQYSKEFLINFYLINDHSDDDSVKQINSYTHEDHRFHLLSLPKGVYGKKKALLSGLQQSTGQFVLFSDADCLHPPDWIFSMIAYAVGNKADMVLGPVCFLKGKSVIARFAEFEFTALTGVALASAETGNPMICNGANLLVQRNNLTQQTDFYNLEYTSGDDMFLLSSFKKRKRHIVFNFSKKTIVSTPPPSNLSEFLSQRLRWVSKNTGLGDVRLVFYGALVLSSNIALGILLVFVFFDPSYLFASFVSYTAKTCIDLIFVYPLFRYLSKEYLIKYIFVFEIFNILYYPVIAIWGLFGTFTWKNRKYKK